ncbi:hypothetical protein [Brucella sp. NBRC 12950]|uniref:CopG family ribbon-helix-helix protein n=1 Tax=Brucella sp. NBRC 12950 TaxID=2994518 RepID=UPI0024A3F537|nr:hypothetical protein [Brucella sp. NBRC 12950]GLU29790.1 hypothetical protein Brsp01_50230 [Brucella sp. NBRC 12950]
MTAALTVRVQDDFIRKLDEIAALSDRSRACLAAQDIENYAMREEWQLAEFKQVSLKLIAKTSPQQGIWVVSWPST